MGCYTMAVPYEVRFAASVKAQLHDLPAHKRALVLDAIETQLTHEPLVETTNRKPLRPNPVAPWELRVDDLRVFYEVNVEIPGVPKVVTVLAVGQKEGSILRIAGEEIKL
jgi:mRNA-degrading endonuclease RelE of RelBE toxin-antitoxin system